MISSISVSLSLVVLVGLFISSVKRLQDIEELSSHMCGF